ncbi:MAG: regulatory protein RecX, partial [Candidatus Roizmanbacteria bacterium]|nr:regulatory protein RecX [Candidatus Roizmanbacteria bacterium]
FILQYLYMEKALSLAYRFLSFRPRTVVEVERYLQKKAEKYRITTDEINAALELLKDQGYLNDLEFIGSFVNSRNSLKPKSKRVLELELKKLGVSQTDINTFFSKNPTDEIALAQKALKKKVKSLLFIADEKKRFIKAISFLQRRGFSYDVSRETYNACFSIEK